MTENLKTVIWKERKLLFSQRGGKKQVIFTFDDCLEHYREIELHQVSEIAKFREV